MKISLQLGLLALLFASCQEVIDIDLNTTAPQIVVEGAVTDAPGPYTVAITKTVNFDEANEYPAVTGAMVTISDGTMTDTLTEAGPGRYQTVRLLQGVPGRTYQLRVATTEGQIFAAASTMPAKVPFENLEQSSLSAPGTANVTVLVPIYRDPVGTGNYYRFVQWQNDTLLTDFNVRDDRNNDGIRISQPIFALSTELRKGDVVRVELQTIDRPTYKYFVALGGSGGAPNNESVPANPDNNFGGACLGYFSAHTVQQKALVIQ